MAFNEQSFQRRFGAMGDQAEGVFEASYPQKWVRFGLNRPPINLSRVPAFIRFTPDYLTAKGLVEVQGFGRDQVAKFKANKLAALDSWAFEFRVDFFLWDSTNRRFGWVRLPDLHTALNEHGTSMSFHEGNAYWALRADCIPVVDSWVPFGEPLSADRGESPPKLLGAER